MQVLSYGYKLPETGDFGDVWFPAMEDNITRLNGHKHDGVDSARLSSNDLIVEVVEVDSGDFADQGDGYYRATVATPTGNAVEDYTVTVRHPTTYEQIYLKTAAASLTTLYVYTNTVLDIEVVFGV